MSDAAQPAGQPTTLTAADGYALAAVRTPIVALNALDDRWAPPASRDAFVAAYRNAECRTVNLHPASLGLKSIGHMGYFRPAARPLWDEALGWLRASTPVAEAR
jgi:predicted alpha/beta hydrolase